jgi:hypothetical protein
MKKVLTVFLILLLSCGTSTTSNKGSRNSRQAPAIGNIEVENGMQQKVSIPYKILNRTDSTRTLDKAQLSAIASQASKIAMEKCKYQPTYEPFEISLVVKYDTVYSNIRFRAKNGFGVPNNADAGLLWKGLEIINRFE